MMRFWSGTAGAIVSRLRTTRGMVMAKGNKMLWLKLGLAAVVAIMIFGVRYAQVSGVPEFLGFGYPDLTDKVMAPLFALLTATLLFIALIPNRVEKLDGVQGVNLCLHFATAVTTYFAGWHWLQDATNQEALRYLKLVLVMGGITAIAFSPYVVALWIGRKSRLDGGPNRPGSMDAE